MIESWPPFWRNRHMFEAFHGDPKNPHRLEMWRRIEDQLAQCLGGRSAGWDYYELMPR